jgi:hypothetical protein
MDDINISVIDSPYTKSYTINKVVIRVMNLELYKSVNVHARLMDNNQMVKSEMILIEGTDYTNWGNNDDYIVTYVLTKLGLTKLTPEQITTA